MSGGYFDSPWPCEDGGPQRLQVPRVPVPHVPVPQSKAVDRDATAIGQATGTGLNLQSGETLKCVTRNTLLSTMTVLGAPGEVFLMTHSPIKGRIGLPATSCVQRIDPVTLKTIARSPRLSGGPWWPGGMAVHRNGDLYAIFGRWAHRLNRQCEPQARLQLPIDEPYNSFVVLDNGLIVTKNLSDRTAARLSVIDPQTLTLACADLDCPEPSIARLSAIGNTVYVVGVRSIFRYHWQDAPGRLQFDDSWRFDYIGTTSQTYGWDVVLDGEHAWFMDNGHHRYRLSMIGAGVSATANRLIRVSMRDARDHDIVTISGLPGGSITNPPLHDPSRHIVVAYDSANRYLRAWRFDPVQRTLTPLWEKSDFGIASHMILYPRTGELVVNDYETLAERVVVLDIETGAERGRVRIGGFNQGVVFPGIGWGRDLYWCSMSRLARVYVET